MHTREDVKALATELVACQKLLTGLGDASRQHIILTMMSMAECHGARVMEIAARTNLSRPAVSRHLQILKEAGIVKLRKEGTRNYYYLDPDMASVQRLVGVLQKSIEIGADLQKNSGGTF